MSLKTKFRQHQSGFTLIEAMVALIILSVGMVGLAYLQATGMKLTSNSATRTQAAILASDLLDRIRSYDISLAESFEDEIGTEEADPPCDHLIATPENELSCWGDRIRDALPEPTVTIEVNGNIVTIEMQWIESAIRDQDPDSEDDNIVIQKLTWDAELAAG